MAERIKLGGLWQNKSKDGTDYLSGRLSPTVKILIFKNNYKQPGDNSPTHIMYLAPLDPDPNAQRGAEQQQADSFFGASDLNAAPSSDNGGDDGEDEFAPAPPARPQTQQRPAMARPNAPAPQAASRPMNAQSTNTRPAQNGVAQAAPRRQPAPPPPAQPDDIGDFEDPFGE